MRALVAVASEDIPAAIAALQGAVDDLPSVGLPWLNMSLHLDLVRLHEAAGDSAEALVEARAANALLAHLDVVVAADDAAMLSRLGIELARRSAPVVTGAVAATLGWDGGWWIATCGDTRARLQNSKGLAYLAELVGHPGTERHALDLVDLVEGLPSGDTGIDRRQLGDAGALLDSAARATYRRRIAELRDEVEDALELEQDDRAAKTQTELDALVAELARAFGLGGRERTASSAAEKARLNVTRALRSAIANVTEALPDAGVVLDRRVRTGLFCAYEPHPDDEVTWIVQSGLNGARRS